MNAETLFTTYFLPLYPEDARRDLGAARARDANPGGNPSVLAHLDDAAEVFVRGAGHAFPGVDLALDFSDASVHRLGAALTPERREAWAAAGPAGTPASELFNVVVHGAAYVGACVVRGHGGAWRVRRPLWESLVALRSPAGDAELAVFHWWLKALAGDAEAGLGDRYRGLVEVPRARVGELPAFLAAAVGRALPRLRKPRYDVFYKYLKAHLPEVRDVGADFPSPARFDELGLTWVDFLVLGGGRMVLVAGLGARGLHLFWLGHAGFEKGAFVPVEKFPEPVVRAQGETIQLVARVDGRDVVQEWMWWGV